MPVDKQPYQSPEEMEYRRRQALRSQRRKKQRRRQLLVLGACLLGVILVVTMVVMIFRAILSPTERTTPQDEMVSSMLSPSQAVAAVAPTAADPSAWNLLLINQNNPMPEGFAPELGTYDQDGVTHYFDVRALPELQQMIADCNAIEGNTLRILWTAPGEDKQNARYQNLVDTYIAQGSDATEADILARRAEPPYGYSDRQTCLSVDFGTATVTEGVQAFAQTPEYAWLLANAADYGFILRFPENKAEITGIDFQPYHFRYVGATDAHAITNSGICLEEYVAAQPSSPPVVASSQSATSVALA